MGTTEVERIVVGLGFATDERSVKKALGAYKSVAAGAAAVATAIGSSLVAAAGFTIGMAESVDSTVKLAKSLSLTTEEYTSLAFAADLSGVSQEKLKVGLMTLQRQLGAAGKGSKDAAALFTKLGVSVTDSNGQLKTSSQALLEISDGIQQLGSDGEKSAMLLQLFGESGAAFKELFKDGSKGISAMIAEAKRLGIVLDSGVGDNAAALNDEWTKLKRVTSALALAFADDLFPPVKALVEQLSAFLSDSDGIVRSGVERAAKTMAHAFEFLATDAGKAALAIGGVTAALSGASGVAGLTTALGPAGKAVTVLGTAFAGGAKSAALFLAPLILAGLVLEDFYVTAQGGDSLTRRFADSLGVGEETARGFAATLKALKGSIEFAGIAANEAFIQFGEFNDFLTSTLKVTLNVIADAIKRIGDAVGVDLGRVVNFIEAVSAAIPNAKERAGGFATFLEATADDIAKLNEGARGKGDDFPKQDIGEALPFVGIGAYLARSSRSRALTGSGTEWLDAMPPPSVDTSAGSAPAITVPVTINLAKGASVEDIERAFSQGIRSGLAGVNELE